MQRRSLTWTMHLTSCWRHLSRIIRSVYTSEIRDACWSRSRRPVWSRSMKECTPPPGVTPTSHCAPPTPWAAWLGWGSAWQWWGSVLVSSWGSSCGRGGWDYHTTTATTGLPSCGVPWLTSQTSVTLSQLQRTRDHLLLYQTDTRRPQGDIISVIQYSDVPVVSNKQVTFLKLNT